MICKGNYMKLYDYYFKICGTSNGNKVISHTVVTTKLDNYYIALVEAIKLSMPNVDTIESIEYYGKGEYTI